MWLRTLVVGLLVWAGATLLIDGWLRRPRGLSLYEHRAPFPAVVCGRRSAEVAEGQLTAERMGDGRAGSGRPPSWFGELAKRRTSRFGVVAALPSQLAASAGVGTEPTERDFVPSHARAHRDRCVRPTPGTAPLRWRKHQQHRAFMATQMARLLGSAPRRSTEVLPTSGFSPGARGGRFPPSLASRVA